MRLPILRLVPCRVGLSPPTRGSLLRCRTGEGHLDGLRSIPAHAGEPPSIANRAATRSKVYPRPRGGATYLRIRGTVAARNGSIPAHAGEPGASIVGGRIAPDTQGLSPPTRGSHRFKSITGECSSGVYPRPRGGAEAAHGHPSAPSEGLSPPTRGSHRQVFRARRKGTSRGSIPAHAGEPFAGGGTTCDLEVYPRPRGGARIEPLHRTSTMPGDQVYPRPRGGAGVMAIARPRSALRVYPRPRGGAVHRTRSQVGCVQRWVYPRPRGGATYVASARPHHFAKGLSPPTRGSLDVGDRTVVHKLRSAVYPRPRGGAVPRHRKTPDGEQMGLSPPTRGSRVPSLMYSVTAMLGSIPAHAGEPGGRIEGFARARRSIPAHAGEPRQSDAHARHDRRVYPRPRGGAELARRETVHRRRATVYPRPRGGAMGLPIWSMSAVLNRRSIPAHAGEPRGVARQRTANGPKGLSPPTRGSLL